MIDFIMIALFVAFMIYLVVGFNKQIIEKNRKRDEIRKKIKNRKKDETTH